MSLNGGGGGVVRLAPLPESVLLGESFVSYFPC